MLLSVKSSCNPKVHLVADGGAYMTVGADFSGSGPKLSSEITCLARRLVELSWGQGKEDNRENNCVIFQFSHFQDLSRFGRLRIII